jgi:MGT family glycosyltransferase
MLTLGGAGDACCALTFKKIGIGGKKPMAKVSILNLPAHGHINPTLAVGQELVRRGEDVTFFATEPFRSVIEATGARFRAYRNSEGLVPTALVRRSLMGGVPMPGQAQSIEGGKPLGFNDSVAKTLRHHLRLLEELLEVLRADIPDYIIYGNLCHAGRFAAYILQRPAIASFVSLVQIGNLAQGRERMAHMLAAAAAGTTEYQQIRAELKQTYGIELPEPFQLMQWAGALNIVYTSKEFQAHSEQYDDRYIFVGPSIMHRPNPVPFPFERLDDRPLIYISLGSIFNDRPDFYRLCVETFEHTPYQVVMVVPNRVDATELGIPPENFIVQPYVPQLELFPRVSVFVTHGGMSSVQEALSFGVPLVVVPQMLEQAATARRIVELGAGAMLSHEELTGSILRATVEQVMTDATFRHNSQKISASLKAAGGYQRAADEIQAFVNRVRPDVP